MERVTIATRYNFCEKLKSESRLRMRMMIKWRIGLYKNAVFWEQKTAFLTVASRK